MPDDTQATTVRLGNAIRDARKDRGWSQLDLAEHAGASRPTVARVERGDPVTTETLAKLAGVLGLELQLVGTSAGRVHSRVALPEADYLARIGEIAYSVSSLEWTLLGDLYRLADRLPEGLTLKSLEPQTTGTIAKRARVAASQATDQDIVAYLTAVADALTKLASLRNNVLHARPATHPTQDQRLSRSAVQHNGKQFVTTGQRFWIDDSWFERAINELNEQLSSVNAVRPPFA